MSLDPTLMLADPIEQFRLWFADAQATGMEEPEAMILATADAEGQPSSRVVLLKDVTADGFSFYTNYESDKGRALAENPRVALNFFWPKTDRQVRIRGIAEKVAAETSDAYFRTRPRMSQIGAWTSPQSRTIPDRAFLLKTYAEQEARFAGSEVPRPPHWGGYLVRPAALEFWQRGEGRLHDRFLYRKSPEGHWQRERLAP